jgi:hypothetical protein
VEKRNIIGHNITRVIAHKDRKTVNKVCVKYVENSITGEIRLQELTKLPVNRDPFPPNKEVLNDF